jgi:hypothetical protein
MNMNVNNEHDCDEYAKPAKSSSARDGKNQHHTLRRKARRH